MTTPIGKRFAVNPIPYWSKAGKTRDAMFVDEGTEQPIVTGQPLRSSSLNRTDPVKVTHRLGRLRCSRGNVVRISGEVLR
jgi:hypothetical protein